MTRDYARSDLVFMLLPRWRLNITVFSTWLLGKLTGGALDPTTGKPRSMWSYRADSYEQAAPKETLAHIARSFGVQAWKEKIALRVRNAEDASKDLKASIQQLMASSSCSTGNSVRIPVDGLQGLDWRRKMIKGAKKQILIMCAYISVDDDARTIVGDLADAARRGVEVHVAFDNFGADAFVFCGTDTRYADAGNMCTYEDLISTLRDAGCKICFWRDMDCLMARGGAPRNDNKNRDYELLSCKNHIKCFISDGELAILTDRNIGSCYFRNPAYSCIEVAVAGPAVVQLANQFALLWAQAGGTPAVKSMAGIEVAAASAPSGALFASLCGSPIDEEKRLVRDCWGAVLVSNARTLESGEDPILMALLLAVRSAQKSVDLMFAYIEICKPLCDELIAALHRGVAVRVVTNSRETNDLFWINAAFLQSMIPVAEAGGKLVMSVCTPTAKGHVHAKVAVVDRHWLLMGSWNAWLRSLLYEVEADVLLDCPALATETVEMIDRQEASDAYRTFGLEDIHAELQADPLGIDPAVVPFL